MRYLCAMIAGFVLPSVRAEANSVEMVTSLKCKLLFKFNPCNNKQMKKSTCIFIELFYDVKMDWRMLYEREK